MIIIYSLYLWHQYEHFDLGTTEASEYSHIQQQSEMEVSHAMNNKLLNSGHSYQKLQQHACMKTLMINLLQCIKSI